MGTKKGLILFTLFLLIIFSTSFVYAYEEFEHTIFIIDENTDLTYRYQYEIQVTDYGMYLPAFTTELYVPSEAQNLTFFDNYGKINAKKTYSEDGWDVYEVRTKDVEYNEEYAVGFEYRLDENFMTTFRYKENYHFEYPVYVYSDHYYICIPDDFLGYPEEYDSNPEPVYNDYYDPYTIKVPTLPDYNFTLIEPIKIYSPYGNQYPTYMIEADVCPKGYNDYEANIVLDYPVEITFDYQNPNETIQNKTYSGKNFNVIIPEIYYDKTKSEFEIIDQIIPNISPSLNLYSPQEYNTYFISHSDKALDGNFMLSLEGGDVYYQVGLVAYEGELFEVNFLRGLINSAMLNTYGETFDNWWSEGALTNMAMKLMKENNLDTKKVKEIVDEAKANILLLSEEELKEVLSYSQNTITFNSAIVDEIETYCPDHVIKINETVQGTKKDTFKTDKQFNNYLIYILKKECNINISNILDKYYISHDEVGKTVDKLVSLESKITKLPIELLSEDLKQGISEIENANELIQEGKITEANSKIELEEEKINTISIKLENILPKYENTKNAISQTPTIVYFPAGMFAQGEFNSAIDNIKFENFEKAEENLNSSLFWVSNSVSLTLLVVIILIIIIGGVVVFMNREKVQDLINSTKKNKKHIKKK